MSRLTIDLPDKDHKRPKTTASLMGLTMKELVILSVDDFMHRKMNKITDRVLKDSEAKKPQEVRFYGRSL